MTYTIDGILYSIISQRKRTARTGYDYETHALPPDTALTNLVIPSQVKINEKFYIVTEIGPNSFQDCISITSIFIPTTVEIIRSQAFYRLRECTTLTFGENSRLKVIEYDAFYDFYKIQSIVFTGNCLKTIGHAAFAFANQNLKELVFPQSLREIGTSALAGLERIENIYYCGNGEFNENIFQSLNVNDTQTNPNVQIHVTLNYQYTKFAGKTIIKDADSRCTVLTDICDLSSYCETIQMKSFRFHSFILSFFFIISK